MNSSVLSWLTKCENITNCHQSFYLRDVVSALYAILHVAGWLGVCLTLVLYQNG